MSLSPGRTSSDATRFDALDGLRGLASMFVMVDHYTHRAHVPGAWTVVDMFFMLSGFVVCHAYRHKIQRGMSLGSFMGARIRRLGPLYWLGSIMGAVGLWWASRQHPELHLGWATILRATGEAMLLIPDFSSVPWPHGTSTLRGPLFPLDPPAWTTFFQLFVNACFFGVFLRWRRPVSVTLFMAGLLGLMAAEIWTGVSNPGWGQQNFLWGFPRSLIEFGLGVALYDLHVRLATRRSTVPLPLTLGCTAVFLLIFASKNSALEWFNVLVVTPLLLLLAVRTRLPARWAGVCRWGGDLSYPLYICHMPVLTWAAAMQLFDQPGLPGFVRTLEAMALAVAVAIGLMHLDRAIRERWTMRRALSQAQP